MIAINIILILCLGVFLFQEKKLGFSSLPIVNFPYFCQNGVCVFSYKISLVSATNTVCAIQSPEATSTLKHGSISIASTTPFATIIEIAKATTRYATTTLLGSKTVAGGNYASLLATTTLDNSATPNLVFPPLTWLVVNVGAKYSSAPNGNCEAQWIVI